MRLLRASIRLHLLRPILPLMVALYCGGLFLITFVLNPSSADSGKLATAFALAPLDSYSDLRIAGENRLILPLLMIGRALVLAAVLSLIASIRFKGKHVMRIGLVNLAAMPTMIIFLLIGRKYLSLKGGALVGITNGEATALLLLLATPVLYAALVFVFGQLVARAGLGLPLRARLDVSLVIPTIVSTWIWIFGSRRLGGIESAGGVTFAYFVAFVFIAVQSVMVGAFALRALEREALSEGASTRS